MLSAFCETSKDILGKKSTHRTNEYVTAFSLHFFASIVLFLIVIVTGIPAIRQTFWLGFVGLFFTVPWSAILYMKAIKLSPLSLAIPMLSFNPIFAALLAIVFEGRFPSPLGWIGIMIICVGLYCFRLNRTTLEKGILHPILNIRNEPGAVAMLGVAFLWSIGSYFSKITAVNSTPIFGSFVTVLIGAFVLFFVIRSRTNLAFNDIRKNFKYLSTLGVLNAISEIFWYNALSIGFTPYAIPIKRTSIVWSSFAGKFLFGEPFGRIKLFGLAIMFFGIVAVVVSY